MAIKVAPHGAEVRSDHLSSVREGASCNLSWEEERSQHADIWREIIAVAEGRPRPKFTWAPAHRELEGVLHLSQRHIEDWCGNLWADFFARIGSSMHKAPDVAVSVGRASIKKFKSTWGFLSRAVQVFGVAGQTIEPPPVPPKAPVQGGSLVQHDLVFMPARSEWRCRSCNTSATTEHTLKGLRSGA
eukprot:9183498-Pyramimonas_sp.AAC.1